MALNITGADSLFIQQQPHINKQAAERDGHRLNRSGHAGPAAVFSFSQQALDSAKDAGRSQFGMRNQVPAATAAFRATFEYGANSVETAAALPATPESAEAHSARADAPRREYWDPSRPSNPSSTKGASSSGASSSKNASDLEEVFVDVEHSESGYDNQIYWSDDGWETKHLIGVDDQTKTVSLGKFEKGTKIEFGIDNGQGDFFKTGSGSKNADGLRHAAVEHRGHETRIGFEDLSGGGDLDFNDAIITVRRVASEREEAAAVDGAPAPNPPEEAQAAEGSAPAEEAWAAEDPAAAEETWAAEGAGSTEETSGSEEAASTGESSSAEQADQQVSYQDLLDHVPIAIGDYFS